VYHFFPYSLFPSLSLNASLCSRACFYFSPPSMSVPHPGEMCLPSFLCRGVLLITPHPPPHPPLTPPPPPPPPPVRYVYLVFSSLRVFLDVGSRQPFRLLRLKCVGFLFSFGPFRPLSRKRKLRVGPKAPRCEAYTIVPFS